MTNTHILEGAFFALCATGATAFALLSVLLACEIIDRLRAWRRIGSRFACVALLLILASPAAGQECPTFPARGVEIIDSLFDERLANGTNEQRQELTRRIAEAMRYELGGWSVKSAGDGRPQSKDSLALPMTAGRFCSWDWQDGTSRRRFDWLAGSHGELLGPPQELLPTATVNHLATGPAIPDPQPHTPPALDLSGLYQRIDGVRGEVSAFRHEYQLGFADLVAKHLADTAQVSALSAQLEKHDKEPGFWQKALTNPTVLASIVGGVTTWLASRRE